MRVETRGDGEPRLAVVGGIHGDEPCGPTAIECVLSSELEHQQAVKYVIANEEALARDVRFIDEDLNRVFGTDRTDTHEAQLARAVLEEVAGMPVLDLHATRSSPVPFITLVRLNETTARLCRATGVTPVAWFPKIDGTLHSQVDGIIVESGPQGSEAAADMAERILRNVLVAEGIVTGECTRSEPVLYRHTGTVEGDGYTFTGENFTEVANGEAFAEKNGEKLRADDSFYPVLMSTDGYEHMLGHTAEKLGRLRDHV